MTVKQSFEPEGAASPSNFVSPLRKDKMEGELTPLTLKLQWLLGTNHGDKPLLKRINYLHLFLLTITPTLALIGLLTTKIRYETMVFAVVYYYITGLGITAGYHRLFAHKAYEACDFVKVLLLLMGAGAFEGSCRWWARDHRAHHRYVDTPKDPYAFTNGFWYAHIGWMLVKQDKDKIGKPTDVDDLYEDPWIQWQHRNYLPIALFCAFIFPTLVAGIFWNDYAGGYFFAGVLRLVFVHHSTFFVNSLAHYSGNSTYSDQHTAKNSVITALVTVGEGYHNFHHEFPSDYRNGVKWYQYDPTKVFIRVLSYFGLTYNLKKFPDNEIQKGALQMKMKALESSMAKLNWGPKVDSLPFMSKEDFDSKVAAGVKLVVLDDFVVDVSAFITEHPGGEKIMKPYIGKNVSNAFRTVYKHSIAAKNLQATFRVARMKEKDN